MSIATEITRLQNAKSALATSIGNKGVTVPSSTKLDGYAALVDSIQTGGGGGTPTETGWSRPLDFPNYTGITLGDNEIYMTYHCAPAIAGRLPSKASFKAIGATYTVEIGTITGGVFSASSTTTRNSNEAYLEDIPTNMGEYVVYHVYASSITSFRLQTIPIGNGNIDANRQPIVEVYGNLYNASSITIKTNTLRSLDLGIRSLSSAQAFLSECGSLESVNTKRWNTSNVTTFLNCFGTCWSLKYLDASKIDTSSATTLNSMFSSCRSLEYIDVTGFDTEKVTNMQSMFSYCTMLSGVDFSHFDMSLVTNTNTFISVGGCMTEIHFNNTLSTIGTQAFNGNQTVLTYIFESTTPPTLANVNAFSYINSDCKIYVPDASVNSYKTASNWSSFASYIYPISDISDLS